MFEKILVAYDGSEGAKLGLERAREIAAAHSAVVHVVAAGRVPEYAETQDEVDEAREQAEAFYAKRLEDAARFLGERGVATQTHLAYGKPSEQILRTAAEIQADLIVVGTHPHSPVRRRLLGGTADKVVDRADCSVLVVR
jgi:nucleotide-binding universal stress UspA family protein